MLIFVASDLTMFLIQSKTADTLQYLSLLVHASIYKAISKLEFCLRFKPGQV